jgi:pimeloyl-ACP methyl ester carboxylesterase
MLNRAAVQKDKIDEQLLSIIKDAHKELKYNGIQAADKVFIYGFSTDAKFAQRFTLLHPEVVMATIAGAIAGTTTFPMSEYKGEDLCYPVGIADFKELTGREFNKDEYLKVPQLFIMGGTDTNDVTEWRDCLPQKDADQIWRLFGRQQIPDRWNATQQILAEIAPNIKCKTYPGIGHSISTQMTNNMVKFFTEHWTR